MTEHVLDEKKIKKVTKMFTVVTNPARMTILNMLTDTPKMNVTQIYTRLNIVQPAASNHLKLLKESGILDSKREAHEIYYFINHVNLEKLIEIVDMLNNHGGA